MTEKAAALDGVYSGRTLLAACKAHLLLGAADQAIAACERASGLNPNDFMPHAFLAAAYANAGDIKQAQASLQAMRKTVPWHTVAQLRAKCDSNHPEYEKLVETYWYEGLRKAGLAEK